MTHVSQHKQKLAIWEDGLSMQVLLMSLTSAEELLGSSFSWVQIDDLDKEPSSDCYLWKPFITCSFSLVGFQVEASFLCFLILKVIPIYCKNSNNVEM
jgi:hypothetical protein